MSAKIANRTGRKSRCIHCSRPIVEIATATEEYANIYGTESEVWVDTKEARALCMIHDYSTAHITPSEWKAAQ